MHQVIFLTLRIALPLLSVMFRIFNLFFFHHSPGVDYTASTASILNLFILSLDRYWSVTSPLKYMRRRTKKRALLMITTVWFVSSLWLIPIIGWHYFEHGGIRTVPDSVCDTEYAHNTALKIVTGILNYYLPLAIMYALYTKIFLEIKTRSKMEVGQKISRASMKRNKENISFSGHDDTNDDDAGTDGFCSSSVTEKDKYVIQNKMVPDALLLDKLQNHVDTDTDVLTAATEDELLPRPEKNVRHLSVNPNGGVDTGTTDSEQDSRVWYNYDELVLDPSTEKVQKYCFEEKEKLLCENGLSKDRDSNTMAFRDLQHISDCLQKESRVQIDMPEAEEKTRLTFPKEHHPAKNHHIKNSVMVKARLKVDNHTSPTSEYLNTPSRTNSTRSVCSGRSVKAQSQNNGHTRRHQSNHKRPVKQISSLNTNGHIMSSESFTAFKKLKVTIKPRSFTRKKRKMNSSLSKEIKAIRQLGVIMGAFTLCFFPYFVCFMVVAFCENCVSSELTVAVTWIGYLNSTLNPFLYPLCNAAFKRKFRQMLHLGKSEGKPSSYGVRHHTPRASLIHADKDF